MPAIVKTYIKRDPSQEVGLCPVVVEHIRLLYSKIDLGIGKNCIPLLLLTKIGKLKERLSGAYFIWFYIIIARENNLYSSD